MLRNIICSVPYIRCWSFVIQKPNGAQQEKQYSKGHCCQGNLNLLSVPSDATWELPPAANSSCCDQWWLLSIIWFCRRILFINRLLYGSFASTRSWFWCHFNTEVFNFTVFTGRVCFPRIRGWILCVSRRLWWQHGWKTTGVIFGQPFQHASFQRRRIHVVQKAKASALLSDQGFSLHNLVFISLYYISLEISFYIYRTLRFSSHFEQLRIRYLISTRY